MLFRSKLEMTSCRGLRKDIGAAGIASMLGPRDFTVILDCDLAFDDMIRVLCHEMVHIKQMARGQYKSRYKSGRFTNFWMGKASRKSYYKQPWELDAWAKEDLLSLKLYSVMV